MSRPDLYADTRAVAGLSDETVRAMWTLFATHYADVDRGGFERDLREKHDVFLLASRTDGVLRGFSTVQSYQRRIGGRRVLVIYSGDTICDPRFWGQRALHSAFLRYVMRRKLAHPFTPAYWFLISKGYKTYLLLARNFVEYWPRYERDTPAWPATLLDALAREKFGDAWRPADGLLRFAEPHGRLRPEVAPTGERELASPHIRFFQQRNPGAPLGDELCCVGRIGLGLALNYARRRLLRALGAAREKDAGRTVVMPAMSQREPIFPDRGRRPRRGTTGRSLPTRAASDTAAAIGGDVAAAHVTHPA